jgi:hypothetical protein
MTDDRLLDCDTQLEIEENFKRILALIDAMDVRVNSLETTETPDSGQ